MDPFGPPAPKPLAHGMDDVSPAICYECGKIAVDPVISSGRAWCNPQPNLLPTSTCWTRHESFIMRSITEMPRF